MRQPTGGTAALPTRKPTDDELDVYGRIRYRLRGMTSARQVCEDLLQDALDDGGTDNITILVGRTKPTHTEH